MRTRFLCLALVLSIAACGSDSISINDFGKKYIQARCAFQVTCQEMPDEATCEASYALNNNGYLTLVAAVGTKTVKYDGEAAASCVNEIASTSCAFAGFYTTKSTDPCNKMFTGTVATGGACFISEECAGVGSVCNQTDPNCDASTTCCPGTCAAGAAKMPVGGHCTGSGECQDGLYCSTATSVCKTPVAQSGGACDEIDGCADPMYCNGDPAAMPFTGKCTAAPARNATCNIKDLLPCADERDYCDHNTMKCTQNVSVGATCDTMGTTSGVTCVGYAYCNNGSCAADPKAGATCDAANGPSCLGALNCTNSSCQLAPAGMACK